MHPDPREACHLKLNFCAKPQAEMSSVGRRMQRWDGGTRRWIDFVGEKDKRFDSERGAQILSTRRSHPDLGMNPGLPEDTRLWAALQNISGGTWGVGWTDRANLWQYLLRYDRQQRPAGTIHRASAQGSICRCKNELGTHFLILIWPSSQFANPQDHKESRE